MKLTLVLFITSSLIFSALVVPSTRAQSKLPAPTSHLSDNAEVIGAEAKQLLENILSNLQLRSGINFTIVTVKTTGGRDIYDFSHELAGAWNIGARTSPGKSLLLVVSVEESLFFTQFSKQVASQLPEGALGEMSQRLRGRISSSRITEALLGAVRQFVTELGAKIGFSTEGMDQTPPTQPARSEASTTVTTATGPSAREQPKPAENPTGPESSSAGAKNANTKSAAPAAESSRTSSANTKKKTTPADDEEEAEDVEKTLADPFDVRVDKLKKFLAAHPDSKSKSRATELLISSYAALADEKMRSGNTATGIEYFFLAISEAPTDISDKLFSGVLSRIPLNLYLGGERVQALKAAQLIETKFASDPKRLLTLSGFYLGIERGDEAARLAEQAIKLAPDMAAAHHALGVALHISLRLDEAAAEYKRALELDPKTPAARRSLADLNRAAGKATEALALYREQLAIDPADKGARSGMVLSLYALDQTAEADKELDAALKDDPRNLTLLAGAAYWFVAHNNSRRGLELAQVAADLEPRYTWGQIALARALVAEKSPQYAERSLRFARQHGRFPTLDYELANTLAAMGLYEEASDALAQSFTIKEGFIETQLATRLPARATNFIELLAPERRASIFQPVAADTESNARMLKGLLAFRQATTPKDDNAKIDEESAIAAAREFAAGDDVMRVYRRLYAATRLLQRGIGFRAAQELADEAREGVEAAILVPAVTVAVQADELRDIRAQAIASGGTPDMPDAPRNVLANILRGRIEDLSGWALFNQDKTTAAIEHLRRAVGILPELTPSWRAAVWHLGAALQQNGNSEEALSYYIKSYNSSTPDSLRRGIIEELYRKVNGSVEGLDDRIGPSRTISTALPAAGGVSAGAAADQVKSEKDNIESPAALPTPGPTPTPEPPSVQTSPTPEPTAPPVNTEPSPAASPTPESAPAASPESSPTPEPAATPTPESPTPSVPAQSPSPSPSPGTTPSSESRPRRVKPPPS